MKSGRWSADECVLFDRALAAYGWGRWKEIVASGMIPGRTNGQIKTHAYKRLKRLKDEGKLETLGEDVIQKYIPTLPSLPDESKHKQIPEIPLPSLPTLPMKAEAIETTERSNPFNVDVSIGSSVVNISDDDKKPHHIREVSKVLVQDAKEKKVNSLYTTLKPPSFWESYASNEFTKRDVSTTQEVSKIQTSKGPKISNGVDDSIKDTEEQVENEINMSKQEINGLQQLLLASETINDKSKQVLASKQESSYGKPGAQSTTVVNHHQANAYIDPFTKYYEGSYVSDKHTMYDFLCDMNDSYFHNVGNRRLRVMVAMRLQTYEQLSTFQRMLFIQDFLWSLSGVVRFIALDSSVGKWRLLRNEFAMQVIQKHFDECLRIRDSSQELSFQSAQV